MTPWKETRTLPKKLASLRQKLYRKAKQEPEFRFYTLYDRIYRPDVLEAAWKQVKSNKGAAGIDGVTIDQIVNSEGGVEQLLEELHEELKTKSYRPQAVKREYIPKPDGRQRPLGIPTIRDRIVQTAAVMILEPIFEADFVESSFGFRPGRNAHQALERVRQDIKEGRTAVFDADLQGYFDTIPHDNLMKGLQTRISDNSVLKLIRMWLETPVVEEVEKGKMQWMKPKAGTPQGGVISPLLANSYLHWFDRAFYGPNGPAQWANARLVRYADDFVITAKHQGKRLIAWVEDKLEGRLQLKLHPEKTKVVELKKEGESFDFLGFTFRMDRDLWESSKRYLNVFPSKKAVQREKEVIREMTGVSRCWVPLPRMIEDINKHLRGWEEYFRYGYPRMAFREVNAFIQCRLVRHLGRRSQRPFRPPEGETYYSMLYRMGLRQL